MMSVFTDDVRRNPFALYDQLRRNTPVLYDEASRLWMIFDYDSAKQALTDHETFSSRNGPDWLIFTDPPRHTKLRSLISQAFTPRSIANMEPLIRKLSRELLDASLERGEMDLVADFSIPLPTLVIAEMLGIPVADRARFTHWNDVLLRMSYVIVGGAAGSIVAEFKAATIEMGEYIASLVEERRASPKDDLLTRLVLAEVEGERLTPQEILGFFQLLLLAGSETTTNLINNAMLCFLDHRDQLALLESDMALLRSAIEEVLRYRSPLQWMYRIPRRDIEMRGQTIPAGKLTLVWIGSANHDPKQFENPEKFDIHRDPNPHVAFGHGIHFCLGAPLSRLEGRIALTDLLQRLKNVQLAGDQPWQPREGLHVHGPAALPIRFDRANFSGGA